MRKADILTLIDDNIDKAFDVLDEIFQKSNPTYNDLSQEFIDQPNNYSLAKFRSRLKRFVSTSYTDPIPEATSAAVPEFYTVLCELDFKTQTNLFSVIYKNKKVAPFLLYGQNNQETKELNWLYNQLLSREKLVSDQPIIVDLGSKASGTFENLLNEMFTRFGIPETVPDNTDPIALLREKLERRLAADHLVCIIRNAANILAYPDELCKLFDDFLRMLDRNVVRNGHEHALIFLFIQDSLPAKMPDKGDYFLWFNKARAKSHAVEHLVSKELKIVDLAPIEKITETDISDWVNWSAQFPPIFRKINCFLGNEKQLLNEGDSPLQVISSICSRLNITMDSKWTH